MSSDRVAGGLNVNALVQDVNYALRALRRNVGFTVVAILTLSLGIGANTAMFSIVNAVLLRPLPYVQPDELVSVWAGYGASRAEFAGVRDRSHVYQGMAAYLTSYGVTLSAGGTPQRINAALATPGLFSLLGVAPAMGRAFVKGEDRPGLGHVVILSHGLWANAFGADPQIVGRSVTLDGVSSTVVGVMPEDFRFPDRTTQAWLPIVMDPTVPGSFWGEGGFGVVGRLKPGKTAVDAQAELRAMSSSLRHDNTVWDPGPDYGSNANVASLQTAISGNLRPTLLLLLASVAAILLIACANIANLLLARGSAQSRAFAIRTALGARRRRLIRQLLTESILLSIIGAAVGVVIALVIVGPLTHGLLASTPQLSDVGIDARVLAFTIVVAIVAGVLAGLVPALRTSDPNLQTLLNDSTRGASGGREHRKISDGLIVLETALAVMLVVGAGLLIHSFWQMRNENLGFTSADLVTARIDLPRANYASDARKSGFYSEVLQRMSEAPGVTSVAATTGLPLEQLAGGTAFRVQGQFEDVHNELPTAAVYRVITPKFFDTMGISLLRGRAFTGADRTDAPDAVIVNDVLAKHYWPNGDPIGQRIGHPWDSPWMTVVGVVGNVAAERVGDADSAMAIYRPLLQSPALTTVIAVRSDRTLEEIGSSLRRVVKSIDPSVPVSDVRTMDQIISGAVSKPRVTMVLLGSFAGLALLLGAVGIYGVVSYAVTQRTREIGIRMALGAQHNDVLRLVIRRGVVLAAFGATVGLALSIVVMRGVSNLLYGVNAADPVTLVTAPLVLVSVAVIASYIPGRRAALVDPATVLNAD